MGNIVRRVPQTIAPTEQSRDLLAPRQHRQESISVVSQVGLGIDPRLYLSWAVKQQRWQEGFSLLVFHSLTGFSPEKQPEDMNRHGQLIIETTQDGSYELRPQEGTHFYTFVLYKTWFLGCFEDMEILRFSEVIPTAKVGIGRAKDRFDLQEMLQRHEIGQIEFEARLNEAQVRRIRSRKQLEAAETEKEKSGAAHGVIGEELADIDAMVETLYAKKNKIEEFRHDPKFSKLSPEEQKAVIDRINERLDAAEINARRDIRG